MKYFLFKSQRLGFRNWMNEDLHEFAKLNADSEVMAHFPEILSKKETKAFIQRLQLHFDENSYNYFAIEFLETGEFIGFIGLALQEYESEFNPATDIGWRLKKSSWGKGYATEGAKRCLNYAFNVLKLESVISICTENNSNSENVMIKIGMVKKGEFKHSRLKLYPAFEKCIWYEITKDIWQNNN